MKILKQIWDEISRGENIDVYLTIIGAVALSALSLLGIALGEKIAGVTLAVLALLAINTLVTRHKLDKLSDSQMAIKWFQEKYPNTVDEHIKNARELWLMGYHLERTILERMDTLPEKLARNDKIKILLLDPDSDAALYANESLYQPDEPNQFRQRIRTSLSRIKQIAADHPANLEVRLSSVPIPFGTYAINPDLPDGVMYIEIYKFKSKIKEPHFVLFQKDAIWYQLYRDQLRTYPKIMFSKICEQVIWTNASQFSDFLHQRVATLRRFDNQPKVLSTTQRLAGKLFSPGIGHSSFGSFRLRRCLMCSM